MNILDVKNPKWANAKKTGIELEVNFEHLPEEYVPFTATADDVEEHGRTLYKQAIAGVFGTIENFVPPADITGEDAVAMLREYRDYLLATVVDPIVSNPLRWAELSEAKQEEYAAYRTALLNITADYPNVRKTFDAETGHMLFADVEFPTKPA